MYYRSRVVVNRLVKSTVARLSPVRATGSVAPWPHSSVLGLLPHQQYSGNKLKH